jgi:DNA-binding CsgD family transcriptional regulator
MKDLKFNAILAKNEIAREIAKSVEEGISVSYIESLLEDIEKYLGTANQPSVSEIIGNNTDSERQFNI